MLLLYFSLDRSGKVLFPSKRIVPKADRNKNHSNSISIIFNEL